ncbi:hypothetical protein GUJ93_ZPchr0006g42937 [Zizania palustris]|uniref:Uncharacterized protein n=1 Tax=Zizania palustris TaxID=103762 RepID=A0A8J5T994_ZIZPA|nr:hypothetical protein GUJ93_ZPchr0006g42937 [Zizania palustris]
MARSAQRSRCSRTSPLPASERTPVTVCLLIKLCVRHGTASDGRLIHRHVFDSGHGGAPFGSSLFVSIPRLHVRKVRPTRRRAQAVRRNAQKNVVSGRPSLRRWPTPAGGRKEEAMRFLVAMLREGVAPNMTLSRPFWVLAARGSARGIAREHAKVGLESDVFVRSS